MTAIISLLNASWVLRVYSYWVRLLLQLRGVEVGQNFTARALPILVKDRSSKIIIGSNVFLKDQVDLRATKGAVLILEHGVNLDKDVRIVATNGARVTFGENADIGCNSIFNCGADVHIGRDVLMAGFCYLQTSNHNIARGQTIKSQGYSHHPIHISDDCWLGGGAFVLPGVKLGAGVVVGANSLVNKDVSDFSIVGGSPAATLGTRH
ncbi:DapH/DapD/GlmU-related protein [Thalassospira sp. HJ]|uniref:acyltransferase n=1 Tax=Thalassospira sp. HJ TaxID=1616823 RepID=UPI0009E2E24B|nr:acyltransferase [Thalassospira sp. HJ]